MFLDSRNACWEFRVEIVNISNSFMVLQGPSLWRWTKNLYQVVGVALGQTVSRPNCPPHFKCSFVKETSRTWNFWNWWSAHIYRIYPYYRQKLDAFSCSSRVSPPFPRVRSDGCLQKTVVVGLSDGKCVSCCFIYTPKYQRLEPANHLLGKEKHIPHFHFWIPV